MKTKVGIEGLLSFMILWSKSDIVTWIFRVCSLRAFLVFAPKYQTSTLDHDCALNLIPTTIIYVEINTTQHNRTIVKNLEQIKDK